MGKRKGKQLILAVCSFWLLLVLAGCGNLDVNPGNGRVRGDRQEETAEPMEDKEEGKGNLTGRQEEPEEGQMDSTERQEEPEEGQENLTGRQEEPEEGQMDSTERQEEPEEGPGNLTGRQEEGPGKGRKEVLRKSEFGSVDWFRDDSGSNTQLVDGWLYGYWSRQLCRVNVKSLKTQVLYETLSPQDGSFCISDGYVYFLERRRADDLEGAKADLRCVKCDGTDSKVLAEQIEVHEYCAYEMSVYGDILYLYCRYGEMEDSLFFRLTGEGTAVKADFKDTLYALLPDGIQDACENKRYRELPNIASCMGYFGYAFVCDGEEKLYRFRPESGKLEEFPLPELNTFGYLFATGEALVYLQDGDTWYTASLDDPERVEKIGKLDCYGIDFWDEKGIYVVDQEYGADSFGVTRLGWDGKREVLHYWLRRPRLGVSVYGDYLDVMYSDGDFLYYDRLDQGDGIICRVALEGDEDSATKIHVYYDSPVKGISVAESFDTIFTAEQSGAEGSFSMTKVYLTEDTNTAGRINGFLEELYTGESEYMEELMEEVRATVSSEWTGDGWVSGTIVEYSTNCSINYIDEQYIGFELYWYQYFQGAAHGIYGSTEYLFSRSTGERLGITDVVKNTEAEICAIIAPYVEAKAEWGTDDEGWESILLEEERIFLTQEGIGIHFDVYEMTCYASGALDIIVPYEAFELCQPGEAELMRF